MTLKIDTLKELLDIEENDLKEMEIEKLRDVLGVVHYAARLIEHEIDQREQ